MARDWSSDVCFPICSGAVTRQAGCGTLHGRFPDHVYNTAIHHTLICFTARAVQVDYVGCVIPTSGVNFVVRCCHNEAGCGTLHGRFPDQVDYVGCVIPTSGVNYVVRCCHEADLMRHASQQRLKPFLCRCWRCMRYCSVPGTASGWPEALLFGGGVRCPQLQ